jgi:hypothetical protein
MLYDEARTLLEQADQVRARVAAAGASTLHVGMMPRATRCRRG